MVRGTDPPGNLDSERLGSLTISTSFGSESRIRVGVNSSDSAFSLKSTGELNADILKCHPLPEWVERAMLMGPCMMHLPLNLGDKTLEANHDWGLYADLLRESETPFVNCHMEAEVRDFPTEDWKEIRDLWLVNVEVIKRRLPDWPLICENVVWRRKGSRWCRPIVDTQLLGAFLEETDSGLLLDTAHAFISSDSLGMTAAEWMAGLPLERLSELHVTGTAIHEGKLKDSMPMTEADWIGAEWIFDEVKAGRAGWPWLAALEYGGFGPIFEWRSDPEVLVRDLNRLRGLADSV